MTKAKDGDAEERKILLDVSRRDASLAPRLHSSRRDSRVRRRVRKKKGKAEEEEQSFARWMLDAARRVHKTQLLESLSIMVV